MVQGQEIEDDAEFHHVPQLESAAGQATVDVGLHMKEGNGDESGAVLHHVKGDALWVTDLSQHEVAAYSSALSATMVPESSTFTLLVYLKKRHKKMTFWV